VSLFCRIFRGFGSIFSVIAVIVHGLCMVFISPVLLHQEKRLYNMVDSILTFASRADINRRNP
jgi:hypothetical protein